MKNHNELNLTIGEALELAYNRSRPPQGTAMTATTPTKPAQGTVADPTSFIWTDDLHTALEAIGVPVRKVRMTELLLLWRGLTSAAQFAAAPAPAASPPSPGEVWRYAPWEDGSLPDGEAMIFCDGWETAVAGPLAIDTARMIVEAHNASLASDATALVEKEEK